VALSTASELRPGLGFSAFASMEFTSRAARFGCEKNCSVSVSAARAGVQRLERRAGMNLKCVSRPSLGICRRGGIIFISASGSVQNVGLQRCPARPQERGPFRGRTICVGVCLSPRSEMYIHAADSFLTPPPDSDESYIAAQATSSSVATAHLPMLFSRTLQRRAANLHEGDSVSSMSHLLPASHR